MKCWHDLEVVDLFMFTYNADTCDSQCQFKICVNFITYFATFKHNIHADFTSNMNHTKHTQNKCNS